MLKIGTDCSGIDAPIQAFKLLNGIKFEHVFSSDIDKNCLKSIKVNSSPKFLYTDIMERDNKNVPYVDFYIAGFPCQSFSMLGLRKGTSDKRGTVFEGCLDYIKHQKPKFVILENVVGILSINKGETFKNIIASLENEGYDVYWDVLNAVDYNVPQNRKRVYIVCIKICIKKDIKDKHNTIFTFPKKLLKTKTLLEIVDHSDEEKHPLPPRAIKSGLMDRIPKDSVFIDLSLQGRTNFSNSHISSPCILRKSDIYCVPKQRRANIKELLALQGFPTDFKQVVSTSELKKQIGNSMCVKVVEEIVKEILKEKC
jgi:DNA (cytosine-5)-methyltransferase 1